MSGVGFLPSAGTVDSREFRTVLGTFATGVLVLTVGGPAPHGMTANAFTSVSKDPPLVLICVDRTAVMHRRVRSAGAFAISVLGARQERLARYFADRDRPGGTAEFDGVRWWPGPYTGAPLLADAVAWLECGVSATHPGGDHTIVVGSVLGMSRVTRGDALIFHRGGFGSLPADRT